MRWRRRKSSAYEVISETGRENPEAMEAAGFARRPDGGWVFVGARVPEGEPLAPGFERDADGIVRYTGR